MNVLAILLTLFTVALLVLEVSLRWGLGLGNPPLYLPDDEIGYLLAPDARVRRFGRRIEINQYSMRSGPIAPVPAPGTTRVLLLGDSVANGGWWTDQEQTISALMTRQLEQTEVLNASANSWGPRNELAYLRRFGTFGARILVLLLNTDDLFGGRPTPQLVGVDRNYPIRRPIGAIGELLERYVLPRPPLPELPKESGDLVGINLEAIAHIHQIAIARDLYFLLALTPLRRELGEPGPRDYEWTLRSRLQTLSEERHIPYLDFLEPFNAIDNPATLYRDHIHLSPKGNEYVSRSLAERILELRSKLSN
ncbi:SGNH/GDSL hydrolase family protein [Oxynema aestuarii]|uniref:SGNH/GDSL hydrolase family protein n=1 Tax=Oxynema aestuarii AP17 TaxID=2064643 RepID=A0A6H1TV20_9CYAN|nr:SGNH/GDSL hydrolase family protein [Oxynema aestuarii]QIZ70056.1 SGNH/GDSL hydrolase family protein [Oxynema aestuarii AP17]